ncbi:MAG: hypothetical protein J7M38_06280 [Armatimonadetes bacterium]|nr:hypothetical protein [Armatimonadota bacterium]
MRTHYIMTLVVAVTLVSMPLAFAQIWDSGDVWGPADVRDTAKPTWFGSSGMIVVPTTQTVGPQSIQAHYHSVNVDLPGDKWMDLWGVNVGITDGLEVGITHLDNPSNTLFQAKYTLDMASLFGDPTLPDVAFGSNDIGNDVNRALYVTVTKDLVIREDRTALLRATIGYGDTKVPGAPLDGVFGGIDFSPLDYLRVQIEHDGENFNASATYWIQQWIALEAGVLDDDFAWGVNASTDF